MAECSTCHRDMRIKARGLCTSCYNKVLENKDDRLVRRTEYPSDDELVRLASSYKTYKEVAEALGITRESFKDYLNIRPELKARVKEAIDSNKPPLIGKAASRQKWKDANPDKVREYNRRWGRNQDPVKRARWNHYNRIRRKNANEMYVMTAEDEYYSEVLLRDPCSYCGVMRPELQIDKRNRKTLDHIVPVEHGGLSNWENLTGACSSCNSSKNDDELLQFMLRKATNG